MEHKSKPMFAPPSLWGQLLGSLQDLTNRTMKRGAILLEYLQSLHDPTMGTGQHRTLGLQSQMFSAWQWSKEVPPPLLSN